LAVAVNDALVSPELAAWVISLRRWFHAHPELSGEERETQVKVLSELAALGIEHRLAGCRNAERNFSRALRSRNPCSNRSSLSEENPHWTWTYPLTAN